MFMQSTLFLYDYANQNAISDLRSFQQVVVTLS